jgi:hypothetical protein
MIDLNIEIPDYLYKQIEDLAIKEKLPIEQLVSIALSAHVSFHSTKEEQNLSHNSWS